MLTTWSEVKFTAMLVLGGANNNNNNKKKKKKKKVVEIIEPPRTSEQITIVPKPELYKGILGRDSLTIPTILGWPTERLVAIICPDDFLTSGRSLRNVFGDDFYGENGQLSHEKKNSLTFHYTGCFTGILIMVYYNPHTTIISSPTYPKQPGALFSLLNCQRCALVFRSEFNWSICQHPGSFFRISAKRKSQITKLNHQWSWR